MKVLFTLAAVLLLTFTGLAPAQTAAPPENYIELLRSDINTQRVAIITEAMQFSQEEADIFWPIYKEYEFEGSKLGDKRIAIIKDYAEHFTEMTDEKAKDLAERQMSLDDEELKLERKFFKKMDKVLPSKTVVKFFQVDRQIDLLIKLQVAAGLPLLD